MIDFKNQETEFTIQDGENVKKMTYADISLICINIKCEKGLSILDMKVYLDLIEKFKKAGAKSKVSLTEEEAQKLKEAEMYMDENKIWTSIHKDLIAFSTYIRELK